MNFILPVTLLLDPMPFLSKSFLFFLISASLVQNIQGCSSEHRLNVNLSFSTPLQIKITPQTPERLKELKKNEKYFGPSSNKSFEKKLVKLEKIFHQKIREHKIRNSALCLIGKKYRKNGQIKQEEFRIFTSDALRFLIKNRIKFHFHIKHKQEKPSEKTTSFTGLERGCLQG